MYQFKKFYDDVEKKISFMLFDCTQSVVKSLRLQYRKAHAKNKRE